jgi:hypothetical protein
MSIKGDVIVLGVAGVVLVAAAWYAKRKIGAAADALAELPGMAWDAAGAALPYLNPADARNIVNQGANGFYQIVTGDEVGTIGTKIYDIYNQPTWTPTTTEEVRALPGGASVAVDLYQWATGSKGDQVNDFKKWWASW